MEGGVYWHKSCLLDVHKQTHPDARGKDMLTLASHEVCPNAWCVIHVVSRATFYRYKEKARNEEKPEHHGNLALKKPQSHTLQATTTLLMLLEASADQMPHQSRTIASEEKVPSMVLPSAF